MGTPAVKNKINILIRINSMEQPIYEIDDDERVLP
jgi:hypothetical protein